jgi:hypothetical protein
LFAKRGASLIALTARALTVGTESLQREEGGFMAHFNFARAFGICAAVSMLGGCGGSQPAATPPGMTSAGVMQDTPATACHRRDNWYFHGACVSHVLPRSGWTFQLPEYLGYTLTVTIPANLGTGRDRFEVSDATGNGDITGKYEGNAFPPYGPTCYSRGGYTHKCPGTPFFYVHITGNNPQAFALYGVPTAQLESSDGFPRRTCFPAHIFMNYQLPEWWTNRGLSAMPRGNSLALALSNAKRYWGTHFHPYVHAVHAFVCL